MCLPVPSTPFASDHVSRASGRSPSTGSVPLPTRSSAALTATDAKSAGWRICAVGTSFPAMTLTVIVALPVWPKLSVAVSVMWWSPTLSFTSRSPPVPSAPSRSDAHARRASGMIGSVVAKPLPRSSICWLAENVALLSGHVMFAFGGGPAVTTSVIVCDALAPQPSVTVAVILCAPSDVNFALQLFVTQSGPCLSEDHPVVMPSMWFGSSSGSAIVAMKFWSVLIVTCWLSLCDVIWTVGGRFGLICCSAASASITPGLTSGSVLFDAVACRIAVTWISYSDGCSAFISATMPLTNGADALVPQNTPSDGDSVVALTGTGVTSMQSGAQMWTREPRPE